MKPATPTSELDPGGIARLQDALLGWYAKHTRDLPWRRNVSPYRVWLSEIMLQQTRVETVIPYFHRFLEQWPTLQDLAAADLEDVLGSWAGLGYYSRARNLHATACVVAARGGFPNTVAGLRELPGIGRYTAGAIASIAFDQNVPAIDGNLERVLSRVGAITKDPKSADGRRRVEALARAQLPPGRAGNWNQALMDLGATVCIPKRPRCGICPLAEDCLGQLQGIAASLPTRAPKRRARRMRAVCGAWFLERRLLIRRRPDTGLLAGMWELPGRLVTTEEAPESVLAQVYGDLGIEIEELRHCEDVVHLFTHRHLTTTVFQLTARGEPCLDTHADLRWVAVADLESLGLSALMRKTLRAASD